MHPAAGGRVQVCIMNEPIRVKVPSPVLRVVMILVALPTLALLWLGVLAISHGQANGAAWIAGPAPRS